MEETISKKAIFKNKKKARRLGNNNLNHSNWYSFIHV